MSLTSNMLTNLRLLNEYGHVPADKGLSALPNGIRYNSLQALMRRKLVELFETGEIGTSFDGNEIRYRDYRLTDDGRKALVGDGIEAPAESVIEEQQTEPTPIPENWLYMAKHANTESARAWWRKKCGITEEN